jgi:hypothetical protein
MEVKHAARRARRVQAEREHKNLAGLRIPQAREKCNPPVSQQDLSGKLAARGVTLDHLVAMTYGRTARELG